MTDIAFPILNDRMNENGSGPNTIGHLARVSKATARKLYDQGIEVIITTCKYGPWPDATNGMALRMPKKGWEDSDNPIPAFDRVVNSYAAHNCTWETGYYPAFYVAYSWYTLHATYPSNRYTGYATPADV